MIATSLVASYSNGDDWVLNLVPLRNHGLVSSLSNGCIKVYPLDTNNGSKFQPISQFQAHESCINCTRSQDGVNIIGTAAADSIKIFDLRTSGGAVKKLHNDRNIPFLSLDFQNNLIAGGTELYKVDSELHVWDLRSGNDEKLRSFVDSHHDDITEIKFHPLDDSVLLSGSTDGYVNIYDLNEKDEEDSLHQVINFASVHSAGWLSARRIYILSHMETFAIHELNDKSEEATEPKPLDFGDVRDPWDCEYVVDVYPGFIATGKNSKKQLKLYPLVNEKVDVKNSIEINGAHGEEVVRSVYVPPTSDIIYTGGEDGAVRVWKTNEELDFPAEFVPKPENAGEPKSHSKEENTHKKKHKHHKKAHKVERYQPY